MRCIRCLSIICIMFTVLCLHLIIRFRASPFLHDTRVECFPSCYLNPSVFNLTPNCCGPPACRPRGYKAVNSQADVVALASYPGSGNGWTRYLLHQSTGLNTGTLGGMFGRESTKFHGGHHYPIPLAKYANYSSFWF